MTRGGSQVGVRAPILVIEDDASVAAFLCAALRRHGYEVVPATTGSEGLQLVATGDYLGVISDIRTPGSVNGADVHDWIRSHRPELGSRMILITGDTINDETVALLKRSGTPCMEKPFRVQELVSIVEKTFGKP